MTNRKSSRKPAKIKSRRGRALGRLGVLPLRRSELAALARLNARFLCRFRGLAFLAMAEGSLCYRDTDPSMYHAGWRRAKLCDWSLEGTQTSLSTLNR